MKSSESGEIGAIEDVLPYKFVGVLEMEYLHATYSDVRASVD